MLLSPTAFFWTTLAALALAILALVLRAAELRHPAPGDIQVKGGLGYMLVGVLSWLAIVATSVAAVFMAGIVLPVLIALVLAVLLRRPDYGTALVPLYPFQIPIAVASLLAALLVWLNLATLIQGGPDA